MTSDPIALLRLRSKIQKPFSLTVSGVSMLPVLHDGDVISVCGRDDYAVGDILVFAYKNGGILVHRLLKIENGRYFLKGDNALRLEDVSKEQIFGAVLLEEDPHRTAEFISASYQISRIFRKCGYNAGET